MTEPLVIMSRVSREDYDRVTRRYANIRAGVRLALAVPGFTLILAAVHNWQSGQADWERGLYSWTLTELMTGIGLIVGPWRYFQVAHERIRREPMLERDVEFRFNSDRFGFVSEGGLTEIPWREVRSARFAESLLLILLRSNVAYYVNAGQMSDSDRTFILTSFSANKPPASGYKRKN